MSNVSVPYRNPAPPPPVQAELYRLDPIDYGRRVAIEKELAADPGGRVVGRAAAAVGWVVGRAAVGWNPLGPRTRGVCGCALGGAAERLGAAMPACLPGVPALTRCHPPCNSLTLLTPHHTRSTEAPKPNAVFDDSGNFLLYPTLLGVKARARVVLLCVCWRARQAHAWHAPPLWRVGGRA